MKKSEAETVTLRLQDQVSKAADAALGALGRLEGQIVREQSALARLEGSFARAKAQLDVLAQGAPDPKAVAAFQKQQEAVAKLTAQLAEASDTLAIMAQTKVTPDALEKAKGAAEELATKLEAAKVKMGELQAGTSAQVNVEAYRKQSAAVASMGDRIAGQKDKISGLKDKLLEAKDGSQSLKDSTKALGDKMGVTNSQGASLISMLVKMGPAAGVVAAAILISVAALGLFVGALTMAISSSGEMRDEQLKLQAATVNSANGFNWLYNSTRASRVAAEEMQEAITKVSGGVALARDKVADYAIQLRKAGFQGKQFETALDAMSVAGTAGGEAMAGQFLESARSARFFGQSVDALAARVQTKLGGVAKAQLLTFGTQMLKLRENIAFVFSGADIEPFLRGLQSVLSFFNKNEAGAKSLRDTVTKFTEMAIGGMLRLGIAIVKAYIAIRTNQTAWSVLGLLVTGLKTTGLVLFAVFVTGLGLVAVAVAAVTAALGLFGLAFGWASNKVAELLTWFKGKSFADVGKAMVLGIATGIKSGASAVYDALKSAVSTAVDGVISFLKVNSPSRLLHEDVGVHMPTGIAGGVDETAPQVAASMKSAVKGGVDAASSAATGSTGASSGDSSGKEINFINCTFGGDLTESTLRRWMRKALEGEGAPEPT